MGRIKYTCIALAILTLAMCTYVLAVNNINNETQSFDQRTFMNNDTCETLIFPRSDGEKVEYCGIHRYWQSKISYGGRLLISCIPGLLAVVILMKPLDSDNTVPLSLVVVLCIALVAWEAWAVGFDIAIFILLEVGYAVDSRITRQPYVQILLLGFAILRSMKLIVMLGAPKDLAKKRRQFVEGHPPKDVVAAEKSPQSSFSNEDLFILVTVVIQLPLMLFQHFFIGKYIHIHGRFFARACAETIFSFLFLVYFLIVQNRKWKISKIVFFTNLATWISVLAIYVIHLIISGGFDDVTSSATCLQVHGGMLLQTPLAQHCLTFIEKLLLGLVATTMTFYLTTKMIVRMTSFVSKSLTHERFQNEDSTLIKDEIWTSRQWEKLQQI